MRKLGLLGLAVVMIGAAGGASARTVKVGGRTFTYGSFRPRMIEVAVATEMRTGRRMNIVRLGNGHMMALVSPQLIMGLAVPSSPADEMLR